MNIHEVVAGVTEDRYQEYHPKGKTTSEYVSRRFWEKVNFTPSCWEWKGAKSKKGYGVFKCGVKSFATHRVSYSLVHGSFSSDLHVCHHCVIPPVSVQTICSLERISIM